MPPFSLIAAISHDGALGQQGGLPWPVLRGDHFWFKTLTMSRNPEAYARDLIAETHTPLEEAIGVWYYRRRHGETETNAVIMGCTTYKSLPKPLVGRESIILTSQAPPLYESYNGKAWRTATFTKALWLAQNVVAALHTFIAGGAQVYAEALQHPDCQTLYLTEVEGEYPDADTWFGAWLDERRGDQVDREIDWEQGRMHIYKAFSHTPTRTWHRTHNSAWITEPERPRYRFGIWAPA